MEVARVELRTPHDLVDPAQFGDGEIVLAECRGKGGVFEFGAGPLDAVGEDRVVIESEAAAC